MAQFPTDLLGCLGFSSQGDLGPLTMYTSRRGNLVFYPRSPPLNPRSPLQLIFEQRWRGIAQMWQALTQDERDTWERACKKSGATITGYNLWVFYQSRQDLPTIRTIERQSGETLVT